MDKLRTYYRFSRYLKDRFECSVFKISVDAGFSCPNMDGAKSYGGCIYCDNKGFSFNSRGTLLPPREQIKNGIEFAKKRYNARKYIIYFQAFTNTYAPVDVLRERYGIIREFGDVVGLSIATRPDCIDENKLDLIEEYAGDYEVWLEYGLQSANDETLRDINRNHTYNDFLKAVELTRKRKSIKICAHVIMGLPGENINEVINTATELGRLKVDGVKIHPLHIMKETGLEQRYRAGDYIHMEFDDYIDYVITFLEYLHPDTIIQRMTADCSAECLVAPYWINEKNRLLSELGNKMAREERYQGRLYVP